MSNHAIGIAVAVGIITLATMAGRPAPTITGASPAQHDVPRFHWYQSENDVDRTVTVTLPPTGTGAALRVELLEKDGRFYTRDGQPVAHVTDDLYLISPGLDLGTFFGARPSASQTPGDVFTVGLRVSPARLLYGTTAPDLVLSKDWAGAGLSFYAPERLVGPTWRHVGIGAWYGYPLGGLAMGGPGWTVGISLSIRN